jgi:hypothetical protein
MGHELPHPAIVGNADHVAKTPQRILSQVLKASVKASMVFGRDSHRRL